MFLTSMFRTLSLPLSLRAIRSMPLHEDFFFKGGSRGTWSCWTPGHRSAQIRWQAKQVQSAESLSLLQRG